MFSLDAPLMVPATGGNGLPPITPPLPYARGDANDPSKRKPAPKTVPQNNVSPLIPHKPYPKPRVWVEKRIALCVKHHAAFCHTRREFGAKLQAWRESQPGYDAVRIAQERYMAKLRRSRG